jgi:rhodanese-related sulfurtransferase
VLRQSRLVETRKSGTRVYYRLPDEGVARFLRAVQTLARERLTEVEHVTRLFLQARDELQPITLAELRRRLREGSATVIDVRPRAEFEAGHIPGAISMPVDEVQRRMNELPRRREIIAYCRGPYCLYSLDAVTLLRKHGFKARRADQGLPEWRGEGLAIAVGGD